MLKTAILGAAMILAVPALAQTTGSTNPETGSSMGATGQTGTPGQTGTTGQTGSTDSGWGTSSGTGSTAGTTGSASPTSSSTGMGSSGAYTGRGGPMEGGRSYPTCSRTVTDNCMQRGGRSHSRARRGR